MLPWVQLEFGQDSSSALDGTGQRASGKNGGGISGDGDGDEVAVKGSARDDWAG